MVLKQALKKTENYHHNLNYKMKYPGKEAYHFPVGKSHLSPCMTLSGEICLLKKGNIKEE